MLDAFFGTMAAATPRRPLERIVVASIPDYLSVLKAVGFRLTKGRKIPPLPADPRIRRWKPMMAAAPAGAPRGTTTTHDPAAILFSGGTTGLPKGIVLTHRNFIAEGMQAAAWCAM